MRSGRAVASERLTEGSCRWLVVMVIAAVLMGCAGLARAQAQAVPEVVRPRSDAPALPSGPDVRTPQPRSENPLADGGAAKPVPDNGVIAPPVSGLGSTPVIKPPAVGTMPVIPPPGSAGGDRGVQPK